MIPPQSYVVHDRLIGTYFSMSDGFFIQVVRIRGGKAEPIAKFKKKE